MAQPTGGQVVAGTATFSAGANALTVTQTSGRAIINWQDFSIAAGELAKFVQPDATSATLNRVVSGLPSSLAGTLQSNGRIFLINPNGILVGAGARIDTAGFLASTLDVANDEFLAGGDLHFTGGSTAAIKNLGAINALGGDIFLIARQVENSGTIAAANGTAGLAAGSEILLTTGGDERLFVHAASVSGTIVNSGTITAATAELKAAGGNAYALAINNSGVVRATGSAVRNGQVWLVATGGEVVSSGTIDVSSATGQGGTIKLLGDMQTGLVNVSGTLDASAPNGGNGGFIETSAAHVKVADNAIVTTQSAQGKSGTWLIDPQDFTISATATGTISGGTPSGDVSGSTLTTALGSGSVTILSSQGSTAGNGDINVNAAVTWSANTLTLTAARDININAVMTASGTASLALNPVVGTGMVVTGRDSIGNFTGRVDFSGTGTLSIGGILYTVIDTLGAPSSTTGADLQGMKGNLAGHYALGANIDATATSDVGLWGATGFTPIGTPGTRFTGTFNGLGHTITALTITPGSASAGLFGATGPDLTFQNVGLVGGSVIGAAGTGGLIGTNGTGSTVNNSYNTGSVSGAAGTGGLVGDNTTGAISNSFATGNVSGAAGTGGLVGTNTTGAISNSYATGIVVGSDAGTGGLVGSNTTGAVSKSYASGSVSGAGAATGGLLGSTGANTVSDSYATGDVSGHGVGVGGLIGTSIGTVTTSYSTGSVSGTGSSQLGALVGGGAGTVTVTTSFWNSDTSLIATSVGGGRGMTTAEMKTQANFTSATTANGSVDPAWDFTNTWVMYDAHTYPLLRVFMTPLTVTANSDTKTYNGASYSGGNGVTPTPSGNLFGTASYSGTSQTAINAGSYIITPSGLYSNQQGYIISYANGALTIGQRGVTVTADSGQTKVYGNADPAPFTYSFTSLGGGVDLSGLLARTAGEPVGGYAITQGTLTNASNPNYTLTYVGDTFAITARPVTVTATAAQTKIYGNADPASFTYSFTDLGTGIALSGLLTRTAGEPVGGYAITQGTLTNASNPNYTLTYAGDTFAITARPVTVTATAGQTKIYGNADPASFTFGNTSLGSGVALSGSLTRAVGETVLGGPYAITQGTVTNANNSNYNLTYAGDTFAITTRPVTVTATAAQTKVYGNADPASFTYTFTALGTGVALVGALDRAAGENVASTYAIGQGTLLNAGNPNYSLTYVGDTFAITARPVTVTATAGQTKTYGNADPASFTYSFTDLGTGSALSGLLTRTAGEPVGSYAITQGTLTNASNPNYTLTYAGDTFAITARGVTVTADAGQTKTYGNANPASFTYSFTDLGTGIALSGLLARTAGEPVGGYAITQGTVTNANNSNYSLTYAGDTFAITTRAVTVTADAGQTKIYGNADPASFTFGNTSLGSGVTLSGSLTRTAGEPVGGYAITQGTVTNANNSNYNLTYAGDTFAITTRAVTVTADAGQTKIYGNADPASFTFGNTSLGSGVALSGSLTRAVGETVLGGPYAITQGTVTNANNSNYNLTYAGDTFAITTRAVTVTATAAQTKIYGNADPAPFTYSFTDLGTGIALSGLLTRTAGETVLGGPYAITQGTVTNANNSNYNLTYAGDTFAITARAVTVTADAGQTKIYGNADPASFTFGNTSLGSGVTLSGSLTRAVGETVLGGPYAITQGTVTNANNSNYNLTYAGDTFAITTRAVTVTATAGQTKTYGNTDPAPFTYSFTDLGTGIALSGLLTRTAGEPVGGYAITQGTLTNASNPNYTLTYAGDTFAITARPVTVTATAGQTKTYGNADPAPFTYSFTDLGTGIALSGLLTRTAGEPVGGYAITQGTVTNASNPNYTLTYVGDTFAITARPVTVTATAGQTKTYGNADPASFTYSFTDLGTGIALSGSLTRAVGETVLGGPYAITQGTVTNANNSNYNLTYAGDTFAITTRAVTVTADAGQTKIYGNADPASFTFGNTSLGSGVALSGSLTRAVGETVLGGPYAITQGTVTNANNSNYNLTYAGDTFAITTRPVTVTADAGQTKIYGNADPASFTFGNTSLGSGVALSGSLTRAVGETVLGGPYAITQGTVTNANNSNYNLTYAGDTFAITTRAVTVTADAGQTKIYGNADPASFTFATTSLGSGVALSGSLTRAAGETVLGEPYAITQGTVTNANNSNYNLTYAGDTFAITTRAVTVTATAGQTKIYGNADPASFTFGNTSLGSGVTLSGSLTRAVGETVLGGPYAITQGTVTNANNSNYNLTYAGDTFAITTRPVTVTATAAQTKIYGNADPAPFTYSFTDLGTGIALSGLLTRAAGEPVGGPYAITQGTVTNANNSNYNLTYAGDTFAITTRAVTVTATAGQTKTYGNTDPAPFTYSFTDLGTGIALSGLLTRTAGEPVGGYAITQGTLTNASNPNYTLTYAGDTFAITARPVTVTATAGQTKTYGNADPAPFTYSFTDLGTGIALSGLLTRTAGEPVGGYAITQGTVTNASNPNYTLTYVGDTFAITARPVTVTATAGQTKTYGNADPASFTYSFTDLGTGIALSGLLTRTAGEPVGGYAITQGTVTNASNPNYTLTYVGDTFAITARPVTVTATAAQTKTYGNADPASFTYSFTDLGTGIALSGSLTRAVGETVLGGPYAITQGTVTNANNSNYNLTYAGDTFAITTRAVTVTADAGQTKIYGNADPASFTFGNTSLGSGVALSGSLTRAVGETVLGGPYAITQGTVTNANNSNYNLTYAGDTFAITTRPVTVTATAAQTKIYGNADPAPFTYSFTDLGTGIALSGLLTRTAGEPVGGYAITQGTLTNAGNPNYTLTYVGDTFAITARPVTVTATAAQTKVYGNADPAPFTYSFTDLGTGIALSGLLTRTAGEPVGGYAITQGTLTNASNPNYTLTYIGDNFAITARGVTLTADAGQTKVYGNADPASFTYSFTDLGTGIALSGLLTRTAGEPVGGYAITQGTVTNASNPNYTLTYVGDNFVITARPVTVTATAGQTKVYGNTDPAPFTYSFTDLGTGIALSGLLTRTAGEPVGGYAITQGTLTNASNPNYTLTYVGDTFAITARPVTVTATTAQTKVYGNADPAPFTYSFTDLGTGSALSGLLTRTAGEPVGSYAITQGTLTNAGNPNYSLTYTGANFAITPRAITLAATTASKTYGNTDPTLGVSITAGSLGSVSVSDTLAEVSGPLSRQAGETVASSPYDIALGSGAKAGNYAITFVADNHAFSIGPATLTYTATAASRLGGGTDPAFSGTITGFVNSETQASATTGSMGFATTAVGASPAGLYPINGSGLTANNGNYLFVQAAGNAIAFTIGSQTALVITADNKTKTYGAALPTFTASFAGFISGDTAASVTGLQFSTTTTLSSNVGTFTITPFGATAPAYYLVGYVPGTLTINPAALTLSGTRVYNGTTFFAGSSLTATGVNGEAFTVSGAGDTTNLTTKNVQTNQPLASVTGLTVGVGNTGAALATNYNSLATAGSTVSVTAASLTASTSNVVKTYSGDTTAVGTAVVTAGTLFGTDSLSGGTFAFTTKDAGAANKTVTVSGISVSDGNSGNNYALTPAANTTSTINAATLIYTANAATRLYGATDPAFSGTITGFVNSETQASATTGSMGFATTAVGASPAGLYPINGSGLTANHGNYLFVQAADNAIAFTIGSQAALVITADNKTKTYSAALPTFTASFAGFISGDTAASVTGLQFSTTATMSSNVGTFTITPFGATAPAYYLVGYVPGTLTINPAALTIAASNVFTTYGYPLPAFDASYSGLTNGDTASVVSGLSLNSSATTHSNTGAYAITPGGGSAQNYAINYQSGVLSVNPATLTITAASGSRAFGAALPAFTATIAGFVNGDTKASVTGLQFNTTATMSSNVGTFTITPFGATTPVSYLVGYVPGTLTISPAALVLTANSATFGAFVNGDNTAVVNMGGSKVVYHEALAEARQQTGNNTAQGSSYREFLDTENPRVDLVRATPGPHPGDESANPAAARNSGGAL